MYIFIYTTPNGTQFTVVEGYDFEHAVRNFYAEQTRFTGNYNVLDVEIFKELIRGKEPKLIIKTVEALLRFVTIRTIYSGDACYEREAESE